MTVCEDCRWNMVEEITDGLYEHYCDCESDNYMTEDGCCHYEEARRDDD